MVNSSRRHASRIPSPNPGPESGMAKVHFAHLAGTTELQFHEMLCDTDPMDPSTFLGSTWGMI